MAWLQFEHLLIVSLSGTASQLCSFVRRIHIWHFKTLVSVAGSYDMARIKKRDGRTHACTDNPKAICPFSIQTEESRGYEQYAMRFIKKILLFVTKVSLVVPFLTMVEPFVIKVWLFVICHEGFTICHDCLSRRFNYLLRRFDHLSWRFNHLSQRFDHLSWRCHYFSQRFDSPAPDYLAALQPARNSIP